MDLEIFSIMYTHPFSTMDLEISVIIIHPFSSMGLETGVIIIETGAMTAWWLACLPADWSWAPFSIRAEFTKFKKKLP